MLARSLIFLMAISTTAVAEDLKPVQVYGQDELLELIAANTHLRRVRKDDCQLVQDIQARAEIAKIPSYQYLWGDMLAYGVCVPTNVSLGIGFMEKAADQGLPEALEQLGRYYATGKWVQVDMDRAMRFLRMAVREHNLRAVLRFADLSMKGYGTPEDKELALRELKNAIITDHHQWRQARNLVARLERQVPPTVLASISNDQW
ncbi:tetratricopeptide repeat protein [Gallaecimonas mangrovi]|uniref:tetratricopeptide repeat protein n=1 Tax=Gallaecimonas mangrovi TaxID=2291597 RepID=UPI0012603163|nr:SEL1-like repeat protein [Gallaecimonas mangrovi]